MTPEQIIQACQCLADDEDEELTIEDALHTLAASLADERMPGELRIALLDVGATLLRLGLAERMRR